jgi:hypothetical protein
MSELAPGWSNPRMSAAQIRKYTRDMKKAQDEAKRKLEEAENSWELEKEQEEINHLANIIDDLDNIA